MMHVAEGWFMENDYWNIRHFSIIFRVNDASLTFALIDPSLIFWIPSLIQLIKNALFDPSRNSLNGQNDIVYPKHPERFFTFHCCEKLKFYTLN